MEKRLGEIQSKWDNELAAIYGGELEVDYLDGAYYVCAFHDEPKDGCDSWVEKLKEYESLGTDAIVEDACSKLNIPVCR